MPVINGPLAVAANGTYQYTVDDASGSLHWCVTGKGIEKVEPVDSNTISVTVGSQACGAFTVKATDAECGDLADLEAKVESASRWVEIGSCATASRVSCTSNATPFGACVNYNTYETSTGPYRVTWNIGRRCALGFTGMPDPPACTLNNDCTFDLLGAPEPLTILDPCYAGCNMWQACIACTQFTHNYRKYEWKCNTDIPTVTLCVDTEGDGCQMEAVSGNGQKDDICKTLKDPFEVKVKGGNASQCGVDWLVTDQPDGANGNIAEEITTFEGEDIFSSAYLRLGALPGSYKAEAVCEECTEGSPQEFRAEAKCPDVPVYRQTEPKDVADAPYDTWCWKPDPRDPTKKVGVTCRCERVDNSIPLKIIERDVICRYENNSLAPGYRLKQGFNQYKIRAMGCALTSLSMVMRLYGSTAGPLEWNSFLTQSDKGYSINGDVNWYAPLNGDLLLDLLLDKNSRDPQKPFANSLMDAYLAKCMPVIVKIINPKTDSWHWVVVTKKDGNEYLINDPGYSAPTNLSYYQNKIYAIKVYGNKNGGCR